MISQARERCTDAALASLDSAESLDDLQSCAAALRDRLGVTHVIYHSISSSGEAYGAGTYSDAWVERYLGRDYARIDPVIRGCHQGFHPVEWKRLDWSSRSSREFLDEAIDHGLGSQGLSVPIRGPHGQFACFTVNHSCPDDEWGRFAEAHRRDLILLAHYFNRTALRVEPGARPPEPAPRLSPRETETLTLLALGYGRAQAAATLSISEHTLRAYIESARFKLGAANTTHAVARAIHRGVIVP